MFYFNGEPKDNGFFDAVFTPKNMKFICYGMSAACMILAMTEENVGLFLASAAWGISGMSWSIVETYEIIIGNILKSLEKDI